MVNRIFIAGLPRSGTTMVQNILDTHSKIYGGSEFDRLPNIITLRNQLHHSVDNGRILEYTSKAVVDDAIRSLIDTLFEGVDISEGIKFISEKTPWNILYFEELFELYPQAKFVMILRNPVDTFNSMKSVGKRAKAKGITPPDFTQDVMLAVAYMEAVFNLMQQLLKAHPDSFYLVRYEDMLADLEGQTKALFNFLEISWESQVLEFYKHPHPGQKTMTDKDIWYSDAKFNMDPKEAQKSSRIITFKEQNFIQYVFRKNAFVNPQQRYFGSMSVLQRLWGKIIYSHYVKKYRFNYVPKRTLS